MSGPLYDFEKPHIRSTDPDHQPHYHRRQGDARAAAPPVEPHPGAEAAYREFGKAIMNASPDPVAGLREAAEAVVKQADADDDPDGQYVDFLVPADAIEALRAALHRESVR